MDRLGVDDDGSVGHRDACDWNRDAGGSTKIRAILINQLNLCHVFEIGTGEGYVIASCRIAIEGKWCGESGQEQHSRLGVDIEGCVAVRRPNGIVDFEFAQVG